MRFVKGHGTGNDFVVLPDPDGDLALDAGLVRALCDRRRGIGADGVLRVVLAAAVPEAAPHAGDARWFMDYRNADGSTAQMCGNGARVYARYLVDAGYAPPGPLAVATQDGLKRIEVPAAGEVTVDMGPPVLAPGPPVPVTVGDRTYGGTVVSMGNPHVVCRVDDPGALDLRLPPGVPPGAFPEGVNVEVVAPDPRGGLVMRVHERGVGETLSCGTGACAAAVAFAHERRAARPVAYDVHVPGGRLRVTWTGTTVLLSGPAVLVAEGSVRPEWLRELR
ncbi:MAG TPA: diaminopimelate epimerase [Frankiaceae bacterium]|nr:diaminopimelate epimerase [Frankiaceae bacterium]